MSSKIKTVAEEFSLTEKNKKNNVKGTFNYPEFGVIKYEEK